jgi:hypothetical protein
MAPEFLSRKKKSEKWVSKKVVGSKDSGTADSDMVRDRGKKRPCGMHKVVQAETQDCKPRLTILYAPWTSSI